MLWFLLLSLPLCLAVFKRGKRGAGQWYTQSSAHIRFEPLLHTCRRYKAQMLKQVYRCLVSLYVFVSPPLLNFSPCYPIEKNTEEKKWPQEWGSSAVAESLQ